jgi:hypothetical protein
MLGIRIIFTVLFSATICLIGPILGHPADGTLDFAIFGLSVAGLVLTWTLSKRWRTKRGGAIMLAFILAAVAALPVRLALEILRQMLRTSAFY